MSVEEFYLDDDDVPLQQGDIVLAPVVRLSAGPAVEAAPGVVASAGKSFEQVDARVTPPDPALGMDLAVQVGWGPAIVVSHDCQLDKDFNRRYRDLRATQMPKQEAAKLAEQDPTLDRWVMVAPVLSLETEVEDEAGKQQALAIRRGEIVGCFPVQERAEAGIPDGVADLTWVSTIDRHTIVARLASLSTQARAAFRFALARTAAVRTPELGFELEAIVGDRIDADRRARESPLVVQFDLHNAGTIQLMAPPGEPPAGGPTRTGESAP